MEVARVAVVDPVALADSNGYAEVGLPSVVGVAGTGLDLVESLVREGRSSQEVEEGN